MAGIFGKKFEGLICSLELFALRGFQLVVLIGSGCGIEKFKWLQVARTFRTFLTTFPSIDSRIPFCTDASAALSANSHASEAGIVTIGSRMICPIEFS